MSKVCRGNKKSSKPTESERQIDKWLFFSKQMTSPLYQCFSSCLWLKFIQLHSEHIQMRVQRTNRVKCGENKNMEDDCKPDIYLLSLLHIRMDAMYPLGVYL